MSASPEDAPQDGQQVRRAGPAAEEEPDLRAHRRAAAPTMTRISG